MSNKDNIDDKNSSTPINSDNDSSVEQKSSSKKKKMYFDENLITSLILGWKETGDIEYWHKIIENSIPLIDSVIREGNYTKYADIEELRAECSIKLWKVIHNFDPKRGKSFTIFSISLKNFLLSYIKRKIAKDKIYTGDADEEFLENICDETYVNYSIPDDFKRKILEIDTRFVEENQKNAIKYFISYFINDGFWVSKTKMIYTAASVFKLQIDKASVLYDYSLLKLRSELMDLSDIELNDIEILRINKRWSVIPELAELIGMNMMKKLIKIMGGINITIPSIRDIQKLEKSRKVLNQSKIDSSFYGMKEASKEINSDACAEFERLSNGVINHQAFLEPLYEKEDDFQEDDSSEENYEME